MSTLRSAFFEFLNLFFLLDCLNYAWYLAAHFSKNDKISVNYDKNIKNKMSYDNMAL